MNGINPRDQKETAAVGLAGRIATCIGIVGAAIVTLATAIGGWESGRCGRSPRWRMA